MHKTPRPEFVALYKKCALPLMKFLIKRMGGDTEAAEEVFSRTCLAAWQGFHTFEYRSTYFTWLCRIALNKMADYYRQQVHERSILIAPTLEAWGKFPDKDFTTEEKVILAEFRSSIRRCLDLLPKEKRQLIYLRFWRDLSIKKIAETMGISERAAEGKIYRAKLALKEVVSNKHPELLTTFAFVPKNQTSG
ncbi:MAG: RNA polymerase sigma factor [Actinobacteria bacterium]|nr:MAG: RNA polymerase sigma factor [Actinomycetota bacterium]